MRIAGALLLAALSFAADYNGPRPPKPDIPYLVHAAALVPTEAVQAKEEQKKDDITYVIDGSASSAKTPLAEPVFLMEAGALNPEHFELYRLEIKNGRREITINQKRKRGPRPIHINVSRIADRLYRIEVGQSLQNGEYSLSPSDSNQAFCFQVY